MQTIGFCLIFLFGLGVLYLGAEGTIHGAVGIARRLGINSLLIGLTLIAYGTSAPELAIDLTAAYGGKTDLAFGDLIGSNLSNLGLILAVAVLIRPIRLDSSLIQFEIPLLLAQAVLVWVLCWDGIFGRIDAMVLLVIFIATAIWTVRRGLIESRKFKKQMMDYAEDYTEEYGVVEQVTEWLDDESGEQKKEVRLTPAKQSVSKSPDPSTHPEENSRSHRANLIMVGFGLVGLIVGAQLMVYGAVNIARGLGVSELTIGLTIVAIGTSLPELATAILASRKQESEIVIGNVAGSNLFNIGCILALVALICPIAIQSRSIQFELPMLIAMTGLLVPFAWLGGRITRWAGIVYLTAYLVFLALQVTMHSE